MPGIDAEFALVWLLVVLVLFPLVVAARRSSRRGVSILLVALWLIVPVAFTTVARSVRVAPIEEADVESRPIRVPDEGYVSSTTCEACHPSEYASWHRSYHRTMTQVVTPDTVLGDFDDVHLEWKGKTYDLSIDDDGVWVELDDPFARDAPRRVKRRVLMSTGSHFDQLYWLDAGREDRMIYPFVFIHSRRLDRWVPEEAAYLSDHDLWEPSSKPGDWNLRCIRCHATAGTSRFTRPTQPGVPGDFDTHVVEFGIACEACHGPAGEHVRRNRDPVHRTLQHLTKEPDGTIVNPSRLDSKASSRICGTCHAISKLETSSSHMGRIGFEKDPYRPGMTGEDPRVFIQKRYTDPDYRSGPDEKHKHEVVLREVTQHPAIMKNSYWSDGMVRVSGRDYSAMIESPCYERGEIACSSCHAAHKTDDDPRTLDEWAHHLVIPEMYGNRACTQCHESFEDTENLVAHTHHEPESSGSACYNCHMPYTTYGMLKGIRSHQIASPSVQETIEVGRPNACNLCHLDQSLGWAADGLERWYGIPRPELSADERALGAGVLWALSGDAGVRALAANSMGWAPAMATSGGDWMNPILAQLLADPYDAVRFIAATSLKKREAFADFDYFYVNTPEEREDALFRARMIWSGEKVVVPEDDQVAILRNERGEFLFGEMKRLLGKRDDSPLFLAE